MSFFEELKRRNVFRVAIAYLALAWLLTEVSGTLLPGFGVPDWAFRFIVLLLVLGFVPVLIFTWAFEITPEGVKREKEVVRDAATEQRTARRLDLLTIGLIVVALALIAVDRLWLGSQRAGLPSPMADQAAETAPADSPAAQLPPDSIAVLPFANRSAKPEDVFFVDGIHDDLLTYISQIGSIKTISRTSVMKYRDSTLSIPEIARELGVATVLEGGVQRAGEQVRINVQLIDARSDDHLWSQIYDRQLTAANVFAIQSEIAESIAGALRVELTPRARERIATVPTENLEALEAYFLGKQKMATRVVADLYAALGHFEQALALDPNFALAYVGLAQATALYENYAGLPREEQQKGLEKAQAIVDRALQLEPNLAEAHTTAGLIEWYKRDNQAAEAAFKQAIELNPNEAQAFQWHGRMLATSSGRIAEALEYSRKAVALDPKSAIIICDYGDVLSVAGQYEEALEQYQKAVAIEPRFSKGYRLIGRQAFQFGRFDQAVSATLKAAVIEPDDWTISRDLGVFYLALGGYQQAEYWFGLALAQAPLGLEQIGVFLGRLHLYRGEQEQAMEYFASVPAGTFNHQLALYHQANHDLDSGDVAAAIARYERAFPGLFDDEPAVDSSNHVPALHLAALYFGTGERERVERLLDRVSQLANSFTPRHFEDEAVIHALRGDKRAALDALDRIDFVVKYGYWREIVVGHPAFQGLLDDPGFQALDAAFEAEMARQLARVQEWEASQTPAPVPDTAPQSP